MFYIFALYIYLQIPVFGIMKNKFYLRESLYFMLKKKQIIIIACLAIAALFILSCSPENKAGNTRFDSFSKAKEILREKVYKKHRRTFYCNCAFTKNGKVRCKVGKGKRAKRIEWEHIVPASRFGHTFEAWKSGKTWGCSLPSWLRKILSVKCRRISGRKNARNKSKEFRFMESDMYNLVPAIGLINQKRSNLPYGEVEGEDRKFGRCDFEIGAGKAEPASRIRGNIGRTYLYMNYAYPTRVKLSNAEKEKFGTWSESDPVDEWECKRCQLIEYFQGNVNPFVKQACKRKGLWH